MISRAEGTIPEEERLRLGKGADFAKGLLKRLRQIDETWESDFQALPNPIMQSATQYLGMVVTEKAGTLLAQTTVQGRPSVNDLATLLAQAMRRPLNRKPRRPRTVRLRGHHQWRGLFPHLEAIGVGIDVRAGQPPLGHRGGVRSPHHSIRSASPE